MYVPTSSSSAAEAYASSAPAGPAPTPNLENEALDPVDPLSPESASRTLLPALEHARLVGGEKHKNKKVRKFYKRQNELIDCLLELHNAKEEADEAKERRVVAIGVYGSLCLNVFLLCLKIYAAISSGSMSVIASLLDSVLDLLSGIILSVTNWYMHRHDPEHYPVGKTRFEPLGVLVFSVIMFMTTVELLIQSVQTLMNLDDVDVELNIIVYVVMGLIIGLKFLAFLYCNKFKDSSDSLEALRDDHRNDVLSNSLGVAGAILTAKNVKWTDSTAAVIICLYIMFVWVRTGREKALVLSGKAAPASLIKKLTYIALTHHPKITHVDTVRAYAIADGFNAEVDIILPYGMPLHEAHDIGETLQHKLELEDEIERAYVHLDYEADHNPWGEHKGWDKPRAQYFRASSPQRHDPTVVRGEYLVDINGGSSGSDLPPGGAARKD